jgi:hypothetical protein
VLCPEAEDPGDELHRSSQRHNQVDSAPQSGRPVRLTAEETTGRVPLPALGGSAHEAPHLPAADRLFVEPLAVRLEGLDVPQGGSGAAVERLGDVVDRRARRGADQCADALEAGGWGVG